MQMPQWTTSGYQMRSDTLVNLCLKTIIKEFGRFMQASTHKFLPSKHFLFLQKAYSDVFFEQFVRTEFFIPNLEFLLNPSLKKVKLDSLRDMRTPDHGIVFQRLRNIAESIEEFAFSQSPYVADLLSNGTLISKLVNLKKFYLYSHSATDRLLEYVGTYCTSLETLKICDGNLTHEGFRFFCRSDENGELRNHTLKYLDITGSTVTPHDIEFILEHFSNLHVAQHINVDTALSRIIASKFQNNIAPPYRPYKLERLITNCELLSENFFKYFALQCPDITDLSVVSVSRIQANVDCAKFINLKKLGVYRPRAPDISSFVESIGGNVTDLTVYSSSMSVNSLLQCSNLRKIKFLKVGLYHVRGSESSMFNSKLQWLEEIVFCRMDFNGIAETICHLFSASPNLKTVEFDEVEGLTNVFNSISKTHCLKSIREVRSYLNDLQVPTLRSFYPSVPNLELLNIKSFSMLYTPDHIKMLKILKPSLSIEHDYIDPPEYVVHRDLDQNRNTSKFSFVLTLNVLARILMRGVEKLVNCL